MARTTVTQGAGRDRLVERSPNMVERIGPTPVAPGTKAITATPSSVDATATALTRLGCFPRPSKYPSAPLIRPPLKNF